MSDFSFSSARSPQQEAPVVSPSPSPARAGPRANSSRAFKLAKLNPSLRPLSHCPPEPCRSLRADGYLRNGSSRPAAARAERAAGRCDSD